MGRYVLGPAALWGSPIFSFLSPTRSVMARTRQQGPKGSEKTAEEWLRQIGATRIQYVGNCAGGGPPDFVIEYAGDEIAVEVLLLHDVEGWNKRKERFRFESELRELIQEESTRGENAPRWHANCEYDGVEAVSSIRDQEKWKDKARKALRTSGTGGKFQLLSKEKRRGRGVTLTLMPASNKGSFSGVSEDEGMIVQMTLSERIVCGVRDKADKVRSGKRAKKYDRWWLVFDDDILVAPIETLTTEERGEIEARVRDCPSRAIWSKIVLMSRFQTVPPPQTTPKWYCAVWEDSRHPLL